MGWIDFGIVKSSFMEVSDRLRNSVLDPGKGVCADPVERVAILEDKDRAPQVGSVSVS
jgi:hypothetical protein